MTSIIVDIKKDFKSVGKFFQNASFKIMYLCLLLFYNINLYIQSICNVLISVCYMIIYNSIMFAPTVLVCKKVVALQHLNIV